MHSTVVPAGVWCCGYVTVKLKPSLKCAVVLRRVQLKCRLLLTTTQARCQYLTRPDLVAKLQLLITKLRLAIAVNLVVGLGLRMKLLANSLPQIDHCISSLMLTAKVFYFCCFRTYLFFVDWLLLIFVGIFLHVLLVDYLSVAFAFRSQHLGCRLLRSMFPASVSQFVMRAGCAKTAEWNDALFGVETPREPETLYYIGVLISP